MTVPALWRLYFGWLSRHIRFSTFLGLYVTTLACKLYSSCPCCVIIKLRVPVYSVRVGISLDSLVKLAVCRFISCVCNTIASSRKIKQETGIFAVFFSAFHMVKIYVFLSLSFNGYHSLFNFDLTSVCKEQKNFYQKLTYLL